MNTALTLSSSGLEWDENALNGRYAFLRKRAEDIRLDLLYYPYRLFHMRGRAVWRFFGERPLEMLLVTDARTGKCLRVSSFPHVVEERLSFECAENTEDFSPARLTGESGTRHVSACVAAPTYGEEEAAARAEEFALSGWGRRCNLPLGPRADIRCTGKESLFLYKPFWIMRPKDGSDGGRMFVFDATTGLGGVSEYWNVVEYVLELQQGGGKKTE